MALLLLVFLCGAPRLLLASEPFEFVSRVIRSLHTCKIADERIKSSKGQGFVSHMKDFVVFGNGIRLANKIIAPYVNSKNKLIGVSATLFSTTYSSIVAINDRMLTLIEEALNDPGKAASEQGTYFRRLSENRAINEELWRMLPKAIVLTTYSLVDQNRTQAGKLRFLTITKAERDTLRSELLTKFGEKVKEKLKGGLSSVDASAALLWTFLAKPYDTSDSN